MDDLFGMLYNDLDPSRKVLTAVTNNLIDSLSLLLDGGFQADTILQQTNGNCALHIAAKHGHTGCLQLLLKHGANPDKQNEFGFTALSLALRHGHIQVVKELLLKGSMLSNTDLIWTSQQMDETPAWQGYSLDMMKLLIQATPDLDRLCREDNGTLQIKERLFDTYMRNIQDPEFIKLYFMTGNIFSQDQTSILLARADEEFSKWIKAFPVGRSLQQQSRVAIRRQLRPNTFSGSRHLPLPGKLQKFISFEEEF